MRCARFGEIIASCQQTAAGLMGMLATHFSRHDDGVPREMLCLNMNFAFKAPVFAGQDLQLRWRVTNIEPSTPARRPDRPPRRQRGGRARQAVGGGTRHHPREHAGTMTLALGRDSQSPLNEMTPHAAA